MKPIERITWSKWLQEKSEKWCDKDRWAVTLCFDSNPLDPERMYKRWLCCIEQSPSMLANSNITSFYVLPKGPMGNRHIHGIVLADGLANLDQRVWENNWRILVKYNNLKAASIGKIDTGYYYYMTNKQNLSHSDNVRIRGKVR